MNIFVQNDYRDILRTSFFNKKMVNNKLTYGDVADACKVQKTFISKVFNKQAHFNRDQLYGLCNFFEFDEDANEYIATLLDHSRSQDKEHQKFLWKKILKTREEKKDTRTYVGAHKLETCGNDAKLGPYYLEPLCQIVHVALGIPKYQAAPDMLARDLRITPAKMNAILSSLADMGIIARTGSEIDMIETDVYLAKDSTYYPSWRSLIRSLTATRLQELADKEAYSFSVTFSSSDDVKDEIQRKFMEFLTTIKPLVTEAPSENIFQMNFDLFSWVQ